MGGKTVQFHEAESGFFQASISLSVWQEGWVGKKVTVLVSGWEHGGRNSEKAI